MNSIFLQSERAMNAVSSNHEMYVSVDILQNGVVVLEDIEIDSTDSANNVNVDGTAAIRRTAALSIANPKKYLPLTPTSLLSPFVSEVRVWSGYRYADGAVDRWPIFVGPIADPQVTEDENGMHLSLTASDRAFDIARRRLSWPFVINAGTRVTDAVVSLIRSVRPTTQFYVADPSANPVLPTTIIEQLSDPWDQCQQTLAAYGMEAFFDGGGVCVIQPIADPNQQIPVWNFVEGDDCIVLTAQQTLSATESYSHGVVIGATLDNAPSVRSDFYDNDPTSATYYRGPFGDQPIEMRSDLITTQAQADAAARALIARKKGATSNVAFTHVPLTALDENDVIWIKRSNLGIEQAFSLQSFAIPLTVDGVMNPTCRSRRI